MHKVIKEKIFRFSTFNINLAKRARENKLTPDEIFGSTFTSCNPGIFGSLFGMAIINQPNVGIMSIGSIKKPVVKETEYGDVIVVKYDVHNFRI